LDAIHSGELAKVEFENYETFNLAVPKTCPGVPDELLNPAKAWTGSADFQGEVTKLGVLFQENFQKYADQATPEVIAAGPDVQVARSKKEPEAEKPAEAPEQPTAVPEQPTAATEKPAAASEEPAPIADQSAPTNGEAAALPEEANPAPVSEAPGATQI